MQAGIEEKKGTQLYKAEWDASPETREEFGGNFEPYAAYRAAGDQGLIGLFGSKKPRLTILQTVEKIQLEWQLNPYLRDKWPAGFDAYRKHRWTEEMAGR